ncbi:MAG: glutamine amidotransferase, partial [Actinophytocola sp.]|nr:glutamine amidotransferase [Actinophytocola sp.]
MIYRSGTDDIGRGITSMLQALKHRGPDSTGFAIYGLSSPEVYVLRLKLAEREELARGFRMREELKARRQKVEERLKDAGAEIVEAKEATAYAMRYRIAFDGDLKTLADL